MGRRGTGIGLAVVWKVVQDHKGYVDVKSGPAGTTFEIYLPVTRASITKEESEAVVQNYRGNGERILVVDDLQSQQEIVCAILEKLGYEAVSVSSGEEAIELLKTESVDLVILDMIMDPGMNGRQTYEKIIETAPGQKAIITSGYSETEEVKQALKLGAGQYLKKPMTIATLGFALKAELDKT